MIPAADAVVQVDSGSDVGKPVSLGSVQTEVKQCKPVTVSWENLTYTVKTSGKVDGKKAMVSKIILDKSAGIVEPGELLAIMGPSGSGKTSLCDLVAGRVKKTKFEGSLLFNGKKANTKMRKQCLSYVAQEDTLMGQFTVYETVTFAARFFYGYGLSKVEFEECVDSAIEQMGLVQCKDTLVGDIFRKGLSGGQKRRLSIAIELISKPSIIILDEPTSGLDSASAYGVVKHLNDLAHSGHTILTTIHQPSSEVWTLFDKFMLLSQGKTLYFGAAKESIKYFSSIGYVCPQFSNPADFLISIVNTDFVEFETHASPEELGNKFSASPMMEEISASIRALSSQSSATEVDVSKSSKKFPMWVDFATLSKRNLMNNARNPGIYWVRFFMYVMLSLMIGLMYLDLGDSYQASDINSRVSIIFFVGAFLVFMSVAVLPFYIMERATFLREYHNGTYTLIPYLFSNFLCALPGIFIISLFSSMCVILISGMNGFGVYLACLFISLVCAESIMNLIASLVPHYIIGIALGAGLFGFFMLCQGFFIVKPDIPDYFIWGYYIAFHTYSFRVFMVNEFEPIESFNDPRLVSGEAVLKFYGIEDAKIWEDMLVLVAWTAFYQICFGLVLKFKWGKAHR